MPAPTFEEWQAERALAEAVRWGASGGAWFARHGYVCLTIDTIQLGELEGVHHGTHRLGLYWSLYILF